MYFASFVVCSMCSVVHCVVCNVSMFCMFDESCFFLLSALLFFYGLWLNVRCSFLCLGFGACCVSIVVCAMSVCVVVMVIVGV